MVAVKENPVEVGSQFSTGILWDSIVFIIKERPEFFSKKNSHVAFRSIVSPVTNVRVLDVRPQEYTF